MIPFIAAFGGIWKGFLGFLKGIPWQAYAVMALLAGGWWYGHLRYNAGQADTQAEWDKAVAAQKAADAAVKPKQEAITERVVTKYVDRIKVVREKGKTIIQEVPRYVTSADCPLTGGFRVFHDAAAAGEVPDPATIADAAPVPATVAASTIASNYGTCHETAATLIALQEWVKEQAALNP